jgi:hypothetical protein
MEKIRKIFSLEFFNDICFNSLKCKVLPSPCPSPERDC